MARDIYAALTDLEVFERARVALARASVLPPGSIERSVAFGIYDSYSQEMSRRMIRHIVAKLREQEG